MQHPLSASPACGGDPPGFCTVSAEGLLFPASSVLAPRNVLPSVSQSHHVVSKVHHSGFCCPHHPRPLCEAGRDASASLGGQGRYYSKDQGKSSHLHPLGNTHTNS